MNPHRQQKIQEILRQALLIAAVVFIATFIIVFVGRVGYPLELEWIEGGMLAQVSRIMNGQPIYTAPSLDQVAFIYTPLYYYIGAGLAYVFGLSLSLLRALSFAASLGIILIIFKLVRRETGYWYYGLVAAGLFAAAYKFSGFWFDLARVDLLFVFFFMSAIYVLRFYHGRLAYVGAGVLLGLSFLTKQGLLFLAVPLMLYSLWHDRYRALWMLGALIAVTATSLFALSSSSAGWSTYYIFTLPGQHPWRLEVITKFWTADVIPELLVCLVLAGFVLIWWRRQGNRDKFWFYLSLLIGSLASSWMLRLHSGGSTNVLIPFMVVLVLLFAMALPEALKAAKLLKKKAALVKTFILALALSQFIILIYNPVIAVPTSADHERAREFSRVVQPRLGQTWIPFHGYSLSVDVPNHAHWMAAGDVVRGGDAIATEILKKDLYREFTAGHFRWMIVNDQYLREHDADCQLLPSIVGDQWASNQSFGQQHLCPADWYSFYTYFFAEY